MSLIFKLNHKWNSPKKIKIRGRMSNVRLNITPTIDSEETRLFCKQINECVLPRYYKLTEQQQSQLAHTIHEKQAFTKTVSQYGFQESEIDALIPIVICHDLPGNVYIYYTCFLCLSFLFVLLFDILF